MIIFDRYQKTKCVTAVLKWIDKTYGGFLGLLGTVGCGKTMAGIIALSLRTGYYVTARRLERVFSANFGPDRKEQERLVDCKFLVVDDLGTERDLTTFAGVFYEVVDLRQGHGRSTIFTSNLDKKQFFERYNDPRLERRLKRAIFITDTGPDLTPDP